MYLLVITFTSLCEVYLQKNKNKIRKEKNHSKNHFNEKIEYNFFFLIITFYPSILYNKFYRFYLISIFTTNLSANNAVTTQAFSC